MQNSCPVNVLGETLP